MKKTLLAASLALASQFAHADAGGFIGIVYQFGGTNSGLGIGVKVTSSDEEDKGIVAAGVTFYPFATAGTQFGADLSVGYNFDDTAVTVGWDFLRGGPQVGIGYSDTEDDRPAAAGGGGGGAGEEEEVVETEA